MARLLVLSVVGTDAAVGPVVSSLPVLMNSAARSPIMTMVVCVLAAGIDGITEPSAMRRPSMPRTFSRLSTTAIRSMPILQEPTK